MKNSTQKSRTKKFDETKDVPLLSKKVPRHIDAGGSGKTSDFLRLAMWNVNGIRSVLNKKTLRDLIGKYEPDFICLNETRINQELYNKQKITIAGYKDYWNFCKCSAGYSGVAIFTKFLPISIFQDLEEPQYSQEGRVLTLQYQMFYLVVVYMPTVGVLKPGEKQQQRLHYKTKKYEVAFQNYCQKLKIKGKGVIVCGDMNVCHEQIDIHVTPNSHKQPGFTYEERKSFKTFLDKGWVDTFRKLHPTARQYTWWRVEYGNRQKNIGKRLDYFIVNKDFMKTVLTSSVLKEIMGSDHCPVYLQIDLRNLSELKKETNEQNLQCSQIDKLPQQQNAQTSEDIEKISKQDEKLSKTYDAKKKQEQNQSIDKTQKKVSAANSFK